MTNKEMLAECLRWLRENQEAIVAGSPQLRDGCEDLVKKLDFHMLTLTPQALVERLGTQEKVAKMLGVSQQAVAKWVRTGSIPEERRRNLDLI